MKNTIIILLLLITIDLSYAQSADQLRGLSRLYSESNTGKKKPAHKLNPEETNEIKLVMGSAFVIYKRMLSSQDFSSCSFTPSCSEYALEAITHKGLIFGSIIFFDRFTRCNTFTPENYEYDPEKKRLYDPLY